MATATKRRAIARETAFGEIELEFPYDPDTRDRLKEEIPAGQLRWDSDDRVWRVVSAAHHQAAIKVLLERYPTAEIPASWAHLAPKRGSRTIRQAVIPAPDLGPSIRIEVSDQLVATVTCPKCHKSYAQPVRVTTESSARAAKRAITPEFVSVCPSCNAMAVVVFHPAAAAVS